MSGEKGRVVKRGLGLAIIVLISGVVALAVFQSRHTHTAVPRAASRPVQASPIRPLMGVHVCSHAHTTKDLVYCVQDDRRISIRDILSSTGVLLSISPADGGVFTVGKPVAVISALVGPGAWKEAGWAKIDAGPSSTAYGGPLELSFHDANVTLSAGVTYRIDVTEGARPVGTTTFTMIS